MKTPVDRIMVYVGKGVMKKLTSSQMCTILGFQHKTISYKEEDIRYEHTKYPQIRFKRKYYDLYRLCLTEEHGHKRV